MPHHSSCAPLAQACPAGRDPLCCRPLLPEPQELGCELLGRTSSVSPRTSSYLRGGHGEPGRDPEHASSCCNRSAPATLRPAVNSPAMLRPARPRSCSQSPSPSPRPRLATSSTPLCRGRPEHAGGARRAGGEAGASWGEGRRAREGGTWRKGRRERAWETDCGPIACKVFSLRPQVTPGGLGFACGRRLKFWVNPAKNEKLRP